MKAIAWVALVVLSASQLFAGAGGTASACVELRVANGLTFSCSYINACGFRFDPDPTSDAAGSTVFWIPEKDVSVFIDFVDNHLVDMETAFIKDKKPQVWSGETKDKKKYTFTIVKMPGAFNENDRVKTHHANQSWLLIERGPSKMYIPTTVLSTKWRPCFESYTILGYKDIMRPLIKSVTTAQRELENVQEVLEKARRENAEREAREKDTMPKAADKDAKVM